MVVFCSLQNHNGLKNKDYFSVMVLLCRIVRGQWDKMNASNKVMEKNAGGMLKACTCLLLKGIVSFIPIRLN